MLYYEPSLVQVSEEDWVLTVMQSVCAETFVYLNRLMLPMIILVNFLAIRISRHIS